jgi:hypothetical protein
VRPHPSGDFFSRPAPRRECRRIGRREIGYNAFSRTSAQSKGIFKPETNVEILCGLGGTETAFKFFGIAIFRDGVRDRIRDNVRVAIVRLAPTTQGHRRATLDDPRNPL